MRCHLWVFAFLLIAGCSRSTSTDHQFEVSTENGVIHAWTNNGPKYDEPLFTYESVLTLKQDPLVEESLLMSVRGMTMDRAGNVYVVDGRNYRIAVYDNEGNYVRSFGRQGSGPGEFRSIEIVQFDGDIFTLWDSNNRRMTRFHRDGTFLDVQNPPNNMRVSKMYLTPDGNILAFRSINDRRDGFAYTSAAVLVLNSKGDTLATVQSEEIVTGSERIRSGTGGSIIVEQRSIPFTSYPEAEFYSGEGIMVTTGMIPEVKWYDLTGRLTKVYHIDMESRRITPEIEKIYMDDLRTSIEDQARQAGREPRSVPETDFPEYAANWSGGFVDDAGYVWLFAMFLPGDDYPPGVVTCFILDPDGCFLGKTTILNTRSTIVDGHLLTAVQDEETGELIPTVYRIRPAILGLKYP